MRHKLRIDTDLTEAAFCDAIALLKVDPHKVVIYCTHNCVMDPMSFVVKYGCRAVFVPDELLSGPDCWGVGIDEQLVWSGGS